MAKEQAADAGVAPADTDQLADLESELSLAHLELADVRNQLAEAEAEVAKLKKRKPRTAPAKPAAAGTLPDDVQRALRQIANPYGARARMLAVVRPLLVKYQIPQTFDE